MGSDEKNEEGEILVWRTDERYWHKLIYRIGSLIGLSEIIESTKTYYEVVVASERCSFFEIHVSDALKG